MDLTIHDVSKIEAEEIITREPHDSIPDAYVHRKIKIHHGTGEVLEINVFGSRREDITIVKTI